MTNVDAVIGVDPGAEGAATILWFDGRCTILRFLDKTKTELSNAFRGWVGFVHMPVYFELVHGMRKDKKNTAFTFGRNTGFAEGCMYSAGFDNFTEVDPQKWQQFFGLGKKYPTQAARKRAQKEKAQELFPNIRVTLDVADSLLIAEYGWRQHYGRHVPDKRVLRPGRGIIRTSVRQEI